MSSRSPAGRWADARPEGADGYPERTHGRADATTGGSFGGGWKSMGNREISQESIGKSMGKSV